jgi:hypothetical protein
MFIEEAKILLPDVIAVAQAEAEDVVQSFPFTRARLSLRLVHKSGAGQ